MNTSIIEITIDTFSDGLTMVSQRGCVAVGSYPSNCQLTILHIVLLRIALVLDIPCLDWKQFPNFPDTALEPGKVTLILLPRPAGDWLVITRFANQPLAETTTCAGAKLLQTVAEIVAGLFPIEEEEETAIYSNFTKQAAGGAI